MSAGCPGDIRVIPGGNPVIPFCEQVNCPYYSGPGGSARGRYRPPAPLRRVLLAFALAKYGKTVLIGKRPVPAGMSGLFQDAGIA